MIKKEYSIDIGGKKLSVEFNDLALRAHGSALVRYGDSVILTTATMSKNAREGGDFLPLSVEYEEKFYASGKILGSRFVRREGRPSDEAILSGRIVDRTIRPLFDQWIRHEIQVIVTVLSIGDEDPDVLSVLGASLALGTSDIPWNGPVSAMRIGKLKNTDDFIINPTYIWRENPDLEFELVACGKDGKVNMIELGGNETSEAIVVKALECASAEMEKIQTFQKMIVTKIGKAKKLIPKPEMPDNLANLFASDIVPIMDSYIFSKTSGDGKIYELKDRWLALVAEKLPEENKNLAGELFEERVNALIHKEAIINKRRADGRGVEEIRPLYAQAGGISPILHGSGIFYRGETHILSALTLGGPKDGLVIDGIEESDTKRFIHHYNFPPFSVGETGRVGGTNRRMIGHGALAEKALSPVIPSKTTFPYTIRIVSEALSSNGSTSMASVCASTLALMDAGIPITRPVAGISSGVMIENDTNYQILTDIQGPEDHFGDMDFKVAGTRDGVTAIQMDVKVDGIPIKILAEAFERAHRARLKILDVIETEIKSPRADISPKAPKILTHTIKQDQIGLIIGPGGKTIRNIQETTGAEDIDIEEDGTIFITGKNGSADKALDIIKGMTREYKAGERFEGEVIKIMDFGAFVRIAPNAEGLVHISEIAPFRIEKVTDYLKEGQIVPVIIKEIDEKKRINLSIKGVNPGFIKQKTVTTSYAIPEKKHIDLAPKSETGNPLEHNLIDIISNPK